MMKRMLLKNLRIFDSITGLFNPSRDVLIEDDRISSVGDLKAIANSADRIVDCQNYYALPGLWECHGHLMDFGVRKPETQNFIQSNHFGVQELSWDQFVQKRLQEFLDLGVTHVRDVGGPLENIRFITSAIRNGAFQGPDIFYSGPMLEKPPLHWQTKNKRYPGFTEPIETIQDANAMIEYLKSNGASLVKTFNKFDQNVFAHIVQAAHQNGLPVTHDPGGALFQWVPVDVAMETGVTCFEHAQAALPSILKSGWAEEHEIYRKLPPESDENRAFFRKIVLHAEEALDRNRLEALCNTMKNNNICYCPTLFTTMALRTPHAREAPNEQEALRRKINKNFCWILQTIVETMAFHGVKLLVGHDASSPKLTLKEMELMEEWGVPRVEIIKGATCYPAEWMKMDDQLGTIEENRVADMVILDENPLEKISNIQSVWAVCHHGNWIRIKPSTGSPSR